MYSFFENSGGKLLEQETLVWPRARKTLNTKTAKFWYIRYITILAKVQELKILETKYMLLMNIVSKYPPHIHYILGYMISPSWVPAYSKVHP